METFPQRELMTQVVVLARANGQWRGKTSSNIKYYASLCSCWPRIMPYTLLSADTVKKGESLKVKTQGVEG